MTWSSRWGRLAVVLALLLALVVGGSVLAFGEGGGHASNNPDAGRAGGAVSVGGVSNNPDADGGAQRPSGGGSYEGNGS